MASGGQLPSEQDKTPVNPGQASQQLSHQGQLAPHLDHRSGVVHTDGLPRDEDLTQDHRTRRQFTHLDPAQRVDRLENWVRAQQDLLADLELLHTLPITARYACLLYTSPSPRD